jgi:MFS family permease
LGAIGGAAVVAAVFLPRLERRYGADRIVLLGTLGSALALFFFALAKDWPLALAASLVAGASWIAAVASLNVSAQLALPDWVRGRGLAIFVSVTYGSLSVGSLFWGAVADVLGLPAAHAIAAASLLLVAAASRRWRLQTNPNLDLTPSMHWPTPTPSRWIALDHGPVLVSVAYQVSPTHRDAFIDAVGLLGAARRRDGAYAWGVFEDATQEGKFVESFLVESWLEHLRERERATYADRLVADRVLQLANGGEAVVSRFIAADTARRVSSGRRKSAPWRARALRTRP